MSSPSSSTILHQPLQRQILVLNPRRERYSAEREHANTINAHHFTNATPPPRSSSPPPPPPPPP